MSSTTAENPAVLSLDIEEEQAPQGRSMAFKILIGLSIVGVAALVAVGIAVGVTAMTALSPTATSPLATYAGATRSQATDTVMSKAPNAHIITKKRGKFALKKFMEAVRKGTAEFQFDLPGLDQALAITTTSWRDNEHLNAFHWYGKFKDTYGNAFIILKEGGVIGEINGHLLRWTISGPAENVVIVEIDHANEKSIPVNSPVPDILNHPAIHSNLSSPIEQHQRHLKARDERVVYQKMSLLLVINKNSCGSTETNRIAQIEAQIELGWAAMDIPTPTIMWYCKKYHSTNVNWRGDIKPSELYPDVDVIISLMKSKDVANKRIELGADLVIGVGGFYSGTSSAAGAARTNWPQAELGFAWVDVNAGGVTVVHELGHLMGMDHQKYVKLGDGSCPVPVLGECNYAGRGKYLPTSPDYTLHSIMDYGPGGSCGSEATSNPAFSIPLYSGFSDTFNFDNKGVRTITLGDTSCDPSSGKYSHNKAYLEYFYNYVSNSYPDITHTCSSSTGCSSTDTIPAIASTFNNGLYGVTAAHNKAGKTFRFKSRYNGKCLHAVSTSVIKLQSCSTSNRQKWLVENWAHGALDFFDEDPFGFGNVLRFTLKNKQYNRWLAPDNVGFYLEPTKTAHTRTDMGTWAMRLYCNDNTGDCSILTPSVLVLSGSTSTWFDRINGNTQQRFIMEQV